ncbi:unnamed protein product [Durusdinium trenchii]|uniref:Uncharacterized protein n=2 Tax=Durusdinium trenchii TaxID=1381693 RepID=A0ABP0RQN7_9DINO
MHTYQQSHPGHTCHICLECWGCGCLRHTHGRLLRQVLSTILLSSIALAFASMGALLCGNVVHHLILGKDIMHSRIINLSSSRSSEVVLMLNDTANAVLACEQAIIKAKLDRLNPTDLQSIDTAIALLSNEVLMTSNVHGLRLVLTGANRRSIVPPTALGVAEPDMAMDPTSRSGRPRAKSEGPDASDVRASALVSHEL